MTDSSKIVGIQGGRGSFNEQAALSHLVDFGIPNYQLQYLHTTENVFKSLENNEVDLGQFAVRNTLGGEVEESVIAMDKRQFEIVGTYQIKIAHALMISPEAKLTDIDTIVTHPQVLRQCEQNLKKRFDNIKLEVCQGELIDPARVAELISEKKLPKGTATISNKYLAQIHKLNVIAENLQDSDNNYTTFLLVKLKKS
jgi:prephenate dehydratase